MSIRQKGCDGEVIPGDNDIQVWGKQLRMLDLVDNRRTVSGDAVIG